MNIVKIKPNPIPSDFVAVESYPLRGPLLIAEAVKEIIEDKVVCDLGCGGGDIAALMVRHAKRVIGIERSKTRADLAENRGFELRVDDFFKNLPEADVYHLWTNAKDVENIMHKIRSNKTIITGGRKGAKHIVKLNCEVIEFNYKEQVNYTKLTKHQMAIDWKGNTWWLAVVKT